MSDQTTYTEQDIQDYLDGNFRGDVQAFEQYLQQNKEAQQLLQYYRVLYSALKEETEMSLSFSLQNAVAAKVLHKNEGSYSFSLFLNGLLFAVSAVVIILCWKVFDMSSLFENVPREFIIIFPVLLIFIIVWHSIELVVTKKRYEFL